MSTGGEEKALLSATVRANSILLVLDQDHRILVPDPACHLFCPLPRRSDASRLRRCSLRANQNAKCNFQRRKDQIPSTLESKISNGLVTVVIQTGRWPTDFLSLSTTGVDNCRSERMVGLHATPQHHASLCSSLGAAKSQDEPW